MNHKWHLLYCDENQSECPVADFIENCPPKHQVKILRFLDLLEQYGPTLPRPYADLLRDGVHELRIKLSGDQIRLLYFFCYQKFIILYDAFVKNTSRVPEKLINRVVDYRNFFMEQTSVEELEEVFDENL